MVKTTNNLKLKVSFRVGGFGGNFSRIVDRMQSYDVPVVSGKLNGNTPKFLPVYCSDGEASILASLPFVVVGDARSGNSLVVLNLCSLMQPADYLYSPPLDNTSLS